MNNEDRLQSLETALTHQARQIEDLSEMLIAQSKDIDFLKRKLAFAGEKLAELQSAAEGKGAPASVSEEALLNKPPHY